MVNKLIVDGLNITLSESTALPFTYTFSTAGTHNVRIGLDNTEEICAYAFKDCTELTKVTFPSKITMIKRNAFENCESLKSIDIPSTIKYVGPNVFDGCSSLSEINFEDTTPPNFLTNLSDDTTCYVPDGSKFVLAEELVKDGSVQYYEKNELGGYDEVDYEALEDGNEYYYDAWLGVHTHSNVVEQRFKNRPVEIGFYDGDVQATEMRIEQGTENYPLFSHRFTPENTSNTNVFYISSNPNLVSVSQDGYINVAKNVAGRSTIYICTEPYYNGTYVSASLNVRVLNETGIQKVDPILNFSSDSLTITNIDNYESITLTNDNNVDLIWMSTNEDVATVDENGDITIIGNGETTIKARFNGSDTLNAKEISYTLIVNTTEEEQTYTIIFKNGDEVIKTVTGPTGTSVSAPDVEREGYDFNGWSINGETPILPVDAITDTDIIYIALWFKNEEPTQDSDLEVGYESEDGNIQVVND